MTRSAAAVLRARGLSPKKQLGQNFLVDAHAAREIAQASTDPEGGTVLEIGPGLGALTEPLLRRAARVHAIERDAELAHVLEEQNADEPKLTVERADALAVDWRERLERAPAPRPWTIAGNLPYLITGRLLERTIALASTIDRAVFMVQAEVAQRLTATAGTKEYGALTVFVRAAFDVRRLLVVRAGAFHPRPSVDSAVVVLTPHRPPRAEETPRFRQAVKAAFGTRRKTLRNAWKGLYGWSREELAAHAETAGISLDARGETLEVEAFVAISRSGVGDPEPV